MTRITFCLSMIGALLALPDRVRAQAVPRDSAGRMEMYRAALKSDLRNLVTAQESYFADHKTYAPTLRDLGERFQASPGIRVILLTASNTGHSEVAVLEFLPDMLCAIYVGNAPRPLGAGEEGEPACRGP